MDIARLVIANPSGNLTAIVFDPTPREAMRDAGAKIQSTYPEVEQVLFVEQRNGLVHGQMAGGEFCGNAARALGYVLARGENSRQHFTMSSGTATPIPVTVDVTEGRATLTTRMSLTREETVFEEYPVPIIHMEGISHAIMTHEHPMFNFLKRYATNADRWRTITHVLEDLGIKDKPASGLIFAESSGKEISITPYVYVRDIDTLYPEMACASGSVAAALVLNGGRASIRQPSKEDLEVSLKASGGQTEILVTGSMRIKQDGPATNLHYSATALSGKHGAGAPRGSAGRRNARRFG